MPRDGLEARDRTGPGRAKERQRSATSFRRVTVVDAMWKAGKTWLLGGRRKKSREEESIVSVDRSNADDGADRGYLPVENSIRKQRGKRKAFMA